MQLSLGHMTTDSSQMTQTHLSRGVIGHCEKLPTVARLHVAFVFLLTRGMHVVFWSMASSMIGLCPDAGNTLSSLSYKRLNEYKHVGP